MVKIDLQQFVTVKMEMSLEKARELYTVLGSTFGNGAMDHFNALEDAIKAADKLLGRVSDD